MGRLGEEVKSVEKLRCVLRRIGCFKPLPPSFLASYTGVPVPAVVLATQPASESMPSAPFNTEHGQGNDSPTTGEAGNDPQQDRGVSGSAVADIPPTSPGTTNSNAAAGTPQAYNFRAAESQVQEVVEGVRFHLAALQRAVDQAHINMGVASQEFGLLLKKVTS